MRWWVYVNSGTYVYFRVWGKVTPVTVFFLAFARACGGIG